MFCDDGLSVSFDAVFFVGSCIEPAFDAAEVALVEIFVAEPCLVSEGADVVELHGLVAVVE